MNVILHVFSHFIFFFSLFCLTLFSMTVENKPLKISNNTLGFSFTNHMIIYKTTLVQDKKNHVRFTVGDQKSFPWVSEIFPSCPLPGVRSFMSQPVGEIRISRYFSRKNVVSLLYNII